MSKKNKSPYKAWRRYRNRENTCVTLHKVFDWSTTSTVWTLCLFMMR